jgi:cyclohexa-1,5-dienecarbonyl-CoA hydratase
MRDYQNIKIAVEGGVGLITLARPPLNVMNIAMMKEINDVLDSWEEINDLKVLLFQAEGDHFSAGVDVEEHLGDKVAEMIEVFDGIFRRLHRINIPAMASVRGSCLGGGCELAAFCDMVLASDTARFGQPEIKVGVFPPIAIYLLPRIMNYQAALDVIFSGKIISAQEALEIGMIGKIIPDSELDKVTEETIESYRKLSPVVLKMTKKAITKSWNDDFESSLKIIEDVYLNELMKTEDAEEGLRAFLEKRKPVWKNR